MQNKQKMEYLASRVMERLTNYLLKERVEECENTLINHKRKIEYLYRENQQLMSENRELETELQNDRYEKSREQEKIYDFKMSFEGKKKDIEKINLEKSKEYITKLIANKFVKEFNNEEGKKNLLLFHYLNK